MSENVQFLNVRGFEPEVTKAGGEEVDGSFFIEYTPKKDTSAESLLFGCILQMPSGLKKVERGFFFQVKNETDPLTDNARRIFFADLIWSTLCDVWAEHGEGAAFPLTQDDVYRKIASVDLT